MRPISLELYTSLRPELAVAVVRVIQDERAAAGTLAQLHSTGNQVVVEKMMDEMA